MWRKILLLCLCAALSWQWAGAAEPIAGNAADRRLALVIGNGNYPHEPLRTPGNDALAMDRRLQALGFEVMRLENASRQRMQEALQEFRWRLAAGGVGLFYFAGHGFQVAERTLLLPVDVDSRLPVRLLAESIDLQTVLAGMAGPRPGKLNLVILDSCLNNPFQAVEGKSPALPGDTLIAYATAPGSLASEGSHHGLYTAALLEAMTSTGGDLEDLFGRVQAVVRQASEQRQKPWFVSTLSDRLRFPGSGEGVPDGRLTATRIALHSRGIMPKDSAEQYELTFWESIKDSNHASDYEAYLQAYPNGRFAALARTRIERLRASAAKSVPLPEKAPAAPAAAPKVLPERPPPVPAAKASPAPAQPAAPVPVAPGKAAGAVAALKELKDCPACPVLVSLPAGSFMMGSNSDDPSEKPAHRVTLGKPFAIGKHEVTTEQWNACVAAEACPRIAGLADVPGNIPARDISWEDAGLYVKWLSKISGKSYRLPSEVEWEYAARGGSATRYWWGEQMRTGTANCKGCGEPWQAGGPVSVGSFAANPYGLHDMNGSVWEWVSDCWHNNYQGAPADARTWDSPNCRVRVIRGGSWRDGASYMLSSTRFRYDAGIRHSQNGFRVARELQ